MSDGGLSSNTTLFKEQTHHLMLQQNECSAKNYGLSINSKSLKARQTKEQ